MATMNISLPEQMKAWAETQAEGGRYANTSDYVRDLIRRDQERAAAVEALQTLVTESLNSGIGKRTMPELLDAAKARIKATG